MEELKNYLHLEKFSFHYYFYAYLDTGDYQADGLFAKHQVHVKFLQEYQKDESVYHIVFCRIRKQEKDAFLEALRELPDKMLLCGFQDYAVQCKQFMEKSKPYSNASANDTYQLREDSILIMSMLLIQHKKNRKATILMEIFRLLCYADFV